MQGWAAAGQQILGSPSHMAQLCSKLSDKNNDSLKHIFNNTLLLQWPVPIACQSFGVAVLSSQTESLLKTQLSQLYQLPKDAGVIRACTASHELRL